jgi:hypothetical protein
MNWVGSSSGPPSPETIDLRESDGQTGANFRIADHSGVDGEKPVSRS